MRRLIIALSTIFCTILIMVSIYNLFPSKDSKPSLSQPETSYTVTDYGGKVAVFEDGKTEPMVVYDIYTHLLPENDIEILRKGIKVTGESQLQSCLEDLGL